MKGYSYQAKVEMIRSVFDLAEQMYNQSGYEAKVGWYELLEEIVEDMHRLESLEK